MRSLCAIVGCHMTSGCAQFVTGTSAEFYARQNYNNAKLSDHRSVADFLTALTNLAHLMNKELSGITGCIEDWTIAMRTIHSFPPACAPSKQS